MADILTVQGLKAYYLMNYYGVAREVRAVDDITMRVARGEVYGIAGESSSGKTSFIKVLAAATRPPLKVVAGHATYHFAEGDVDVATAGPAAIEAIRWKSLSYVMQGSMSVLNPLRKVRRIFEDFASRPLGLSGSAFQQRVEQHLERLQLSPQVLDAYPHELSGGMRQRVTIGLATVCHPQFVIADEPTTALDVVVQKEVLGLIKDLQRDMGASIIFVTHDMAVHANVADRIGIIYAGRLVEEAPTTQIFMAPKHPYTAHLVASLPRIGDTTRRPALEGRPPNLADPPAGCRFHPRCPLAIDICRREVPPLADVGPGHRSACWRADDVVPLTPVPAVAEALHMSALLTVEAVSKSFPIGGVLSGKQVLAVDNASFAVGEAGPEIFTIIGESGSGKTTLARMILGLERPTAGEILFQGQPTTHPNRRDRLAFMAKVQPVFQNPFEAFNPLKRVERYLASTARRFRGLRDRKAIEEAMDEALQMVGLSYAELKGRFPHELSGGQLQRAAIARALLPRPALLIADEPVSMVDASLRMAIVNQLRQLRDDFGVSVIYITHDLATAYYISDRLIIMQRGRIVEMGPARPILDAPDHPYSRLLKASVLSPEALGNGGLDVRTDLVAESNAALETAANATLVPGANGRLVRRLEA